MNLQPTLRDELVVLNPLQEDNLDALFEVASDPLIWEQHPESTRYQRPVFEKYFRGAMESGGAFLITSAKNGEIIGCTRYYDYHAAEPSVVIGFTFLARKFWGGAYNKSIKQLMLHHAFQWVPVAYLHIGEQNMRSRKAIEKLGGQLAGKKEEHALNTMTAPHCIYAFYRDSWKPL